MLSKTTLILCFVVTIAFANCNRRHKLAPDAILAVGTATSFSDGGKKTIVFGDGTTYVMYRSWNKATKHRNAPYQIVKFQISASERHAIRAVFRKNAFFSLPKIMRQNATDGSAHRLIAADDNHCHGTFNYLLPQANEKAIRERFHSTTDRYIKDISQISHANISVMELFDELEKRSSSLPSAGCKQRMVKGWIGYIAPYLLLNVKIHQNNELQNRITAMPKLYDNSNVLFPFPKW